MDGPSRRQNDGWRATRTDRRRVLAGLAGGLLAATGASTVAAQCELVGLYPGYPGYRGYVTGLDGVGDHACLSDLEAADPDFGLASERARNLAAARRLGLFGAPEEWTWENWLAVEGERGLAPSTCYACAIAGAEARPEPVGAPVASDDPRLLLGGYGTDWAFARFATDDPTAWSLVRRLIPYDHYARALIGMMNPGHWNAPQMLAGYEAVASALMGGGGLPSFGQLYATLLAQGGYAPTPASAPTDDQAFMVEVGIEAALGFGNPWAVDAYQRQFSSVISEWRGERYKGSTVTLAEWLRANGPPM